LIVLGRPLTEVYAALSVTRFYLIAIGGAVLLVGFVGGLLITGRALRPIGKISDTAKTIAEGNHQQRIELSDAPEELAGLADTLNNTFAHLNESIETQKRFSADASHELRTPIAVVIAQAEAALKRERTPEEYQTVLNACLRSGRRMKSLANSLLELTRLSGAGFELSKERCDLNEVLAGAVDSASLLSEKHPVVFQGLEKPLEANVDRDRIHQVVMNLISNAIQHNPQGCEIAVSLKQGGIIEIADNGIGIPEESLPHIFDRFYRVDKSRTREQGGAGLGLSIAQSLVEAHNGTISASSMAGSGATFTIKLPLT
jgi:two-component system OmpR family sensor kinase